MNRIQRYHRNADAIHWAIVGLATLACASFDAAVILAWVAA
jgi:hypothetical protein